jgi:hypothetical protein
MLATLSRTVGHSRRAGFVSTAAVTVAAAALVIAAAPHPARAQTTDWIGTTGDWFEPANWSAGVPTATTAARVLTDGTIQINGGTAVAFGLTLNAPQPAVQQTAGDFTLTGLSLRGGGSYRLSGGTQVAASVDLNPGTRYELAGGTLRTSTWLSGVGVSSGVATLDFTGGGSLDVAGGLADLGGIAGVTMGAPEQGHVTVQPNALLVVPAGFNPATGFASFASAGVVHNLGSTLTVPAGTTLAFNTTLPDPVIVHGRYDVYRIEQGLQVHPGGAATTTAGIFIADTTSGVFGGELDLLQGGGMIVGGNQPSNFTLAGGRLGLSGMLLRSFGAGNVATFHMTGGTLEKGSVDVGASFGGGKGAFIQDGGTATGLSSVRIGNGSSYTLNGGSVSAPSLFMEVGSTIAGGGPGTFTQNGGTFSGRGLTVRDGSTVALNGGTHTVTHTVGVNAQSSLTYTGGTVSLGALVLASGSTLAFGIDDDDLLEPITITTTNSMLGGTLAVSLLDGFSELDPSDQIVLLDAPSSLQGSFTNVADNARLSTDGGSFRVNYGTASPFGGDRLVLSDFQPVPEPGAATLALAASAASCLRRRRRRRASNHVGQTKGTRFDRER